MASVKKAMGLSVAGKTSTKQKQNSFIMYPLKNTSYYERITLIYHAWIYVVGFELHMLYGGQRYYVVV